MACRGTDAGDGTQATWDANDRPVMFQVLELMASWPVPRDSRALLAGSVWGGIQAVAAEN
ncbi:MAG: hypothetical protein ACK5QW_01575 [Cyanobacteriota bacterium]|jgi:hypothetical protein